MRPRIRTNTLTGYVGLARSAGLEPAALLRRVGLDIADLEVPDRWIAAAPAARLLELSAQESHWPDFGLRLAAPRRLGTLGPLSVVLRDEPDLRSAVALLIRYERAYNEALHMRLREDESPATIEVWLELGEPTPHEQALDLVLAALLGIIRALVRSDWEPVSASFARGEPPDASPWRRLFGPRVSFDQGFTGMVLAAGALDAAVVLSDSSVRPYSREFLRTAVPVRPAVDGADPDDLEQAIEFLLPLGRMSISQVSRELGQFPRHLQDTLAAQGTSFSAVVHATRARLAERYLPNERYSLTEVSQLLGFGAPSAFSRWFRQQFGTSPTAWRRSGRAASDEEAPSADVSPGRTVRTG